jgi:hypothetical protein
MPINDDKQVQEALAERQVSNVHTPDLVWVVDDQVAQKIRAYILCVMKFAEVRPRKQRYDIHEPHKAPNPLPVDSISTVIPQIVCHFAIPPRWVFQVCLVNN